MKIFVNFENTIPIYRFKLLGHCVELLFYIVNDILTNIRITITM